MKDPTLFFKDFLKEEQNWIFSHLFFFFFLKNTKIAPGDGGCIHETCFGFSRVIFHSMGMQVKDKKMFSLNE